MIYPDDPSEMEWDEDDEVEVEDLISAIDDGEMSVRSALAEEQRRREEVRRRRRER